MLIASIELPDGAGRRPDRQNDTDDHPNDSEPDDCAEIVANCSLSSVASFVGQCAEQIVDDLVRILLPSEQAEDRHECRERRISARNA